VRLDFIDFPTGWRLQDTIGTDSPPHDRRCSAHVSAGGFLCDCKAIIDHWVSLGGDPERYRAADQ
jgi:hypothetical protein